MSLTEIEVLFEGTTEENVLNQLRNDVTYGGAVTRSRICQQTIKLTSAGGQGNLPRKLQAILKDLPLSPEVTKRLLVVWDLDNHEVSARCGSVIDVVKKVAPGAYLEPLAGFDNVYVLRSGPENLRLGLHVSCHRYDDSFCKATTDDYVLKLALRESTASKLLEDCKRNKPDWTITSTQLINKITREIPALLKANGIPSLPEAKEFVRFYAAVLSLHTSPAVFAAKTLHHAEETDIKEIFAPLLAAIQHLETA